MHAADAGWLALILFCELQMRVGVWMARERMPSELGIIATS